MAKWDVILTVIALNFLLGVLSQTDINTANATVEENNDAGTSSNSNAASVSPSIAINEEIPGKQETSDSAGPTNNQTTTSTFPPLIHNSHPQDVATSTQSTVSTTPTTSQTTHTPVHEEEKSVQKSQTDKINASKSTPKENSSNMLRSSVIVLSASILIWKTTY